MAAVHKIMQTQFNNFKVNQNKGKKCELCAIVVGAKLAGKYFRNCFPTQQSPVDTE